MGLAHRAGICKECFWGYLNSHVCCGLHQAGLRQALAEALEGFCLDPALLAFEGETSRRRLHGSVVELTSCSILQQKHGIWVRGACFRPVLT